MILFIDTATDIACTGISDEGGLLVSRTNSERDEPCILAASGNTIYDK